MGREEIRAPLKTPAWEAICEGESHYINSDDVIEFCLYI